MAEAVSYSRSSSDQSARHEANHSRQMGSADRDFRSPHLSHLDRFHDPFHARYRKKGASYSKGKSARWPGDIAFELTPLAAQLAVALKTYPVTEEEILYSNVMLKQSKLPSIARYPNFGVPQIKH